MVTFMNQLSLLVLDFYKLPPLLFIDLSQIVVIDYGLFYVHKLFGTPVIHDGLWMFVSFN